MYRPDLFPNFLVTSIKGNCLFDTCVPLAYGLEHMYGSSEPEMNRRMVTLYGMLQWLDRKNFGDNFLEQSHTPALVGPSTFGPHLLLEKQISDPV